MSTSVRVGVMAHDGREAPSGGGRRDRAGRGIAARAGAGSSPRASSRASPSTPRPGTGSPTSSSRGPSGGDPAPILAESGRAVTFRREGSNAVLSDSGIEARDAVGEPLDAWMGLAPGGTKLHLVVDVAEVAWPVTVDSVFVLVSRASTAGRLAPLKGNKWIMPTQGR